MTVTLDGKDGQVELAVADTGIGIAARGAVPHLRAVQPGRRRRSPAASVGPASVWPTPRRSSSCTAATSRSRARPGKGSRFVVRLLEGADRVPEAVRDRRVGPADQKATELRRQEDQEPREWAQRLQRQDEYRFSEIGEVDRPAGGRARTTPGPRRPHPGGRGPRRHPRAHQPAAAGAILDLRRPRTGGRGWSWPGGSSPDLIITDFMMPEMDGLTHGQGAAGRSAVPARRSIIMLTAKSQLEDRLAVRDAGVDVYLGKPFSPRELEAAVQQLLEKRGRHVNNLMRAHAEGLEIVSGGLAHEIQNPLTFIKGAQLMIVEQHGQDRASRSRAPPSPIRSGWRPSKSPSSASIGWCRAPGEGVSRIEGVVALMRRYAREGYPKEASDVVLRHRGQGGGPAGGSAHRRRLSAGAGPAGARGRSSAASPRSSTSWCGAWCRTPSRPWRPRASCG